ISTGAGVVGWLIGKKLQHLSFVKKFLAYFGDEHRGAIKRFGFWMVVLGALTPLPFSLTCWLAGIFKLPFQTFIVACAFRIPRFVIYYWAIFYSGEIGSLIRSLL
ncbi:MAG: VTT domain-containing protein, partial [Bdellovibrionales bacterium]|nr:VTT domain-containing protein [Bdellovibrionales bacterium]NQZ19681.1 VTT domain-containing protein [Bdellovibrionales bacterium]